MKTRTLTIQIFCLAVFFFFNATISPSTSRAEDNSSSSESLRILCYNIHFGMGNDRKYDLQRLADVINKEKPDLVALQEVDVVVKRSGKVHQAQVLGQLTNMAVRYGPTQHYQGGLYGNAILSKLPILNVEIQPLPYTESSPQKTTFPRAAIAVTVRGKNGKPLKFISTHFQHNMEEDRINQAKAINKLFAADTKMPTILAGDMNATPDSEPVKILLEQWTNAIDKDAKPTAPSKKPRSRIDYIFHRPEKNFELLETKVIAEPMASDHCPVFAEFKLKN